MEAKEDIDGIIRFAVGKTYLLSQWGKDDYKGTVEIRAELTKPDRNGIHLLLANFTCENGVDKAEYLGARGYTEPMLVPSRRDPSKLVWAEMVSLTGSYYKAKAYSIDEVGS